MRLLAVLALAAAMAACKYGTYDGSPLDDGGSSSNPAPLGAGPPVTAHVLSGQDTTLTSSDGALTVFIPANAYPAPVAPTVTITITPQGLVGPNGTPSYEVTATNPQLEKPIGMTYRLSLWTTSLDGFVLAQVGPSGGGPMRLVATRSVPVPTGQGQGQEMDFIGSTMTYGRVGLTGPIPRQPIPTGIPDTCLATCCGNQAAMALIPSSPPSCLCAGGNADPKCLTTCDLAAGDRGCAAKNLPCGSMACGSGSFCCLTSPPSCRQNGSTNPCPNASFECRHDADCSPSAPHCCITRNTATCKASCNMGPPACTGPSDCPMNSPCLAPSDYPACPLRACVPPNQTSFTLNAPCP